jgi:GTP cyclohydrolase II
LQDQGADTVEANVRLGLEVDLREYRQCAEILFDLGLCKVKVISNNPLKLRAVEEAGLQSSSGFRSRLTRPTTQ